MVVSDGGQGGSSWGSSQGSTVRMERRWSLMTAYVKRLPRTVTLAPKTNLAPGHVFLATSEHGTRCYGFLEPFRGLAWRESSQPGLDIPR